MIAACYLLNPRSGEEGGDGSDLSCCCGSLGVVWTHTLHFWTSSGTDGRFNLVLGRISAEIEREREERAPALLTPVLRSKTIVIIRFALPRLFISGEREADKRSG